MIFVGTKVTLDPQLDILASLQLSPVEIKT